MNTRTWVLSALCLTACSGRARDMRSLGSESAKGWQVELRAAYQHDHVQGGLSPDRDDYWVSAVVQARQGALDVEIGRLWSVQAGSEAQARAWFAAAKAEHCTDGERILFRVPQPAGKSDPRWHLLVASPSVLAVETHAAEGEACAAVLARIPPTDAWLVAQLAKTLTPYPEVRLGGAVVGQVPHPQKRLEWALQHTTPFMLAVREGRQLPAALDFFVDRLPAYDELARWMEPGGDFYGPHDTFAEERRLLETAAKQEPLRTHLRQRAAPVVPEYRREATLKWFEGLRR